MGPSSQRLGLPEAARIDAVQIQGLQKAVMSAGSGSIYLTQAQHEVSLKGGPGRDASDGDGCSAPVPEFLGDFERVLRDFCCFFLPHKEYVTSLRKKKKQK